MISVSTVLEVKIAVGSSLTINLSSSTGQLSSSSSSSDIAATVCLESTSTGADLAYNLVRICSL